MPWVNQITRRYWHLFKTQFYWISAALNILKIGITNGVDILIIFIDLFHHWHRAREWHIVYITLTSHVSSQGVYFIEHFEISSHIETIRRGCIWFLSLHCPWKIRSTTRNISVSVLINPDVYQLSRSASNRVNTQEHSASMIDYTDAMTSHFKLVFQ